MRLSRILMLIGALALPAVPVAAQGKAIGRPAGVGKPTTTTAKGPAVKGKSADAKSGTLVKGKSADHATSGSPETDAAETTDASSDSKALGQKELADRIDVMMQKDSAVAKRIASVLGDMPLADATANFKNQGQFIKAINAIDHNPALTFAALQTEMTAGLSVEEAIKKLTAAAPPAPTTTTPTTPTTTTTTTTTSATP